MDGYIKSEHLIYYTKLAAVLWIILKLVFFIRLDCSLLLKFYETFRPNIQKLNGKVVWVVGSSTGIGEELALQLAEQDCKLILTSTTESKLEQVKQKCLERSEGKLVSDDILVLAYDISNLRKNDLAFKQVIEKFGKLDVLICNAARAATSFVVEETIEDVQTLFNVNFFSHVQIVKIVLRHWLLFEARNGNAKLNKQILATSSVVANTELAYASTYTATKKAINAFFHDLAIQHQSDGIYVTIAMPGPVRTDIVSKGSIQGDRKINDKAKMIINFMSAERCAHLMLVSLANKLHETYVSSQPVLTLTYLSKYLDFYFIYLIRTFGLRSLIEKQAFSQ